MACSPMLLLSSICCSSFLLNTVKLTNVAFAQRSCPYAHYARLPTGSVKALHEAAARLPRPAANGRPAAREGRSPEGVDREQQRRQPAPKRQHPARAASLAVRARWEAQAQRAKQLQAEAEVQALGQPSPQPPEQSPGPSAKEQPAATGLQTAGQSEGQHTNKTPPHSSRPAPETAAAKTADASEVARVPGSVGAQPAAQQRGSQVPLQDGQESASLVMPVGNGGKAEYSHQPTATPTEPAQ